MRGRPRPPLVGTAKSWGPRAVAPAKWRRGAGIARATGAAGATAAGGGGGGRCGSGGGGAPRRFPPGVGSQGRSGGGRAGRGAASTGAGGSKGTAEGSGPSGSSSCLGTALPLRRRAEGTVPGPSTLPLPTGPRVEYGAGAVASGSAGGGGGAEGRLGAGVGA